MPAACQACSELLFTRGAAHAVSQGSHDRIEKGPRFYNVFAANAAQSRLVDSTKLFSVRL
jgi:hypothetical protein